MSDSQIMPRLRGIGLAAKMKGIIIGWFSLRILITSLLRPEF